MAEIKKKHRDYEKLLENGVQTTGWHQVSQLLENPKVSDVFRKEKDHLRREYPYAKNYTFLDFLLNKNYKLFHKLF